MNWTDAMIARLKVLHSEDLPFSTISATMSRDFKVDLSRGSVIGKANRLGLTMRKVRPNGVIVPRSPRRSRNTPFRMPPRKTLLDQADELAGEAVSLPPDQSDCAVSLMRLAKHHCRWPIDGEGGLMLYCGAGALEGGSYCPRHHRLAYQRAVRLTQEERERRSRQARQNNARVCV